MSWKTLIRGRPSHEDPRSRRVVVLIECHLNQNARDRGAARYPAVNRQLLDLLQRSDVGLVQIPCPEMHCLGPHRERPKGVTLREAMETPQSRSRCRELARETADRIDGLIRRGVEIVAILGGDVASPGCAVHDDPAGGLSPRSGVFMQELDAELRSRSSKIAFRGIRESRPEPFADDLQWISERLG